MTYNECLDKLKNGTYIIDKEGLAIRMKPIPETDEQGAIDERALAWERKCRPCPQPKDLKNPTMTEVKAIRAWMGCKNQDLSNGIISREEVINTTHGKVPVSVYAPSPEKIEAIVVYIHGGGFYGGTTAVVENCCKLIAERGNAVVISVDYGLAPENKFPKGLNQCYEIVKWAYENGKALNGNPQKLVVIGDSAGGNLAAGCCMLDTKGLIKLQVLLYPTVIQTKEFYDSWDENAFSMKGETQIKKNMVYSTRLGNEMIKEVYFNCPEDAENPLVSPLLSEELNRMPMSMIVTAEYDALRTEAENYGRKLLNEKVDVIFYRYLGMGHAFFEHPGEFPQSEDCINEICSAIRAL